MSIIIAVKENNRVLMMGDSMEISREESYTLHDEKRLKILVLGDVLVGSAGRVRSIRRLVSHPEWFDTKGAELDKRFIVNEIVPKFWAELDEHGFIKYEDESLPISEVGSCGILPQNPHLREFPGLVQQETIAP